MLKVVGASWYQTRISTYILIGSGLLVIGAFFVANMERPQYDGTYCATVYWSKNAGFKIEYWKQRNDLENIPKGVARTCYKDSTYENGWSQIEIETQRTYPDWVQAFGAGLLEGSLTWNNIHNQWINTISSACDRDENSQNFCTWIRDVLSSNYRSVKEMLKKRSIHDHYWHQIHLFFYQLEGLESGWRKGAKRARSDLEDEIPSEDFILMNAAADIQDLKIYFENFVMHYPKNNELIVDDDEFNGGRNFFIPSATMLLKINRDNNGKNNTTNNNSNETLNEINNNFWNVFFGHSSAGSYSSMLRVQKRYKFHYHFTLDQKMNTIPGIDITFTSYPGVLASTDDFYIIKGRQVHSLVGGVALKNENLELWKSIDLGQIIPLSARVMAANRLAQSRKTWAKAMSRHPSTGSKQWILIDLKKINSLNSHSINNDLMNDISTITENNNKKNSKSIIWIVEQLPGRLHAEDMTDDLLNDNISYWFANGTPYFTEILDASKIIIEDVTITRPEINITNLDDIEYILRKNAFRGDLLGEQSIPYGNIDMKLFSYSTNTGKSNFYAIAGPLFTYRYYYKKETSNSNSIIINNQIKEDHDNDIQNDEIDRRSVRNDIKALAIRKSQGPFKWSNVDSSISDVKHDGHPDEWNFDKTSPKWAWYD